MKVRLLALAVVLSNVVGNFALNWGMKQDAQATLLGALLNPFVVGGILLLILWTLLRTTLFSLADLSFVLPVTSFGYALSALLGFLVMHEIVSGWRWAGIALITAGTLLVGAAEHKS